MTEPSGQSPALDNLLTESRTFPPSEEFAAQANATRQMYADAAEDREAFWAAQADYLHWDTRWQQVLDWSNAPFGKWFVGGKLNVAYNAVDRHVEAGNGDRVAFHWEGEPGDTRTITYADLKREVSKAANALTSLGLVAGDRVAIYMPMIPETVVAMLACARLGLTHSVVFGGFSAEALRARIEDAEAKLVITSDGQNRRGKALPLKASVDEAVARTPTISARAGGQAHRRRRGLGRRPRHVVARTGRRAVRRAHARGFRRRAPAVHPLHLGHHREAEGHPAHHRRLPHAGRPTRTATSSTSSRRPTSTGAPRTSAGSPGTATSCTAR